MFQFLRFLTLAILVSSPQALAETQKSVIVRVPGVGVAVKLTLTAKSKSTVMIGLTMKDWSTTGNTAVIMSAKPFACGKKLDMDYKEVPAEAYKDDWEVERVLVPKYAKDWYGCVVSMHGRDHWKQWDTPITPSIDRQNFIVIGYWSEED